ncbi:MAG: amidohydrolase family protein [Mogibacterium sp.]|nr:amidohydrolase family protein [Mogibacterium sp.]
MSKLDVLIINGILIDGTGADPVPSNIGILGDRIRYIGTGQPEAAEVLDISGCCISPGFIDAHSHADFTLPIYPRAESAIGQGITTLICGNCGMSPSPCGSYYAPFPIEEKAFRHVLPAPSGGINPGFTQVVPTDLLRPWYEAEFHTPLDWSGFGHYLGHLSGKTAVNVHAFAGHSQIRLQVLGPDCDRFATEQEIAEIVRLCEQCMDEGAAGISLGLDYCSGRNASRSELLAVAKAVAAKGKILAAHWRSRSILPEEPDRPILPVNGILEMLELAQVSGAHVHISHIDSVFKRQPDVADPVAEADRLLQTIAEYRENGAEITYDSLVGYTGGDFYYPLMAARFLPYVIQAGGIRRFSEALSVGNYKKLLAAEINAGQHQSRSPITSLDPIKNPKWDRNVTVIRHRNPAYEGRTLYEIRTGLLSEQSKQTEQAGQAPDYVTCMFDLLTEDPYTCITSWLQGLDEFPENIRYQLAPDMCLGLDVSAVDYDSPEPFPEGDYPVNERSTGTYCGFIKYLLNGGEPLARKIMHLTGNTARAFGLKDRGVVKEGSYADLTVFDPNELAANEDLLHPATRPSGIRYVFVNGRAVLREGRQTELMSGAIL